MTTVTIGAATICAGGGHVHTSWQLNSGPVRDVDYITDDLRGTPGLDEVKDAIRTILRGHIMGMSRAQARAALEAGITITIAATA